MLILIVLAIISLAGTTVAGAQLYNCYYRGQLTVRGVTYKQTENPRSFWFWVIMLSIILPIFTGMTLIAAFAAISTLAL